MTIVFSLSVDLELKVLDSWNLKKDNVVYNKSNGCNLWSRRNIQALGQCLKVASLGPPDASQYDPIL